MKLTKQPNLEISGVVAKNIWISGSNMNRVLRAPIFIDWLWLVLHRSVSTGRFDFSVNLKSRQKQKHPHPLLIELETLCTVPQVVNFILRSVYRKPTRSAVSQAIFKFYIIPVCSGIKKHKLMMHQPQSLALLTFTKQF